MAKLGMVLPEKDPKTGDFIKQNNSVVYQEYERDPTLNTKPENSTPSKCKDY